MFGLRWAEKYWQKKKRRERRERHRKGERQSDSAGFKHTVRHTVTQLHWDLSSQSSLSTDRQIIRRYIFRHRATIKTDSHIQSHTFRLKKNCFSSHCGKVQHAVKNSLLKVFLRLQDEFIKKNLNIKYKQLLFSFFLSESTELLNKPLSYDSSMSFSFYSPM